MNGIYKHQRWIYDATRKYYLLGRDKLITQLNAQEGDRVLEVACGTGRNLLKVHQQYPSARLYGLDISSEMLTTAGSKLNGQAELSMADATSFSPQELFGEAEFEKIILSFGVSMIPEWQQAIAHSTSLLAKGGEIHLVDFSDQRGLPSWFSKLLLAWLRKFHVEPRTDLHKVMVELAGKTGGELVQHQLFRGYSQYYRLRMPGV